MRLKMFDFVDEVIKDLDNLEEELEEAAIDIEEYFESILINEDKGYMNVVSRVKQPISLKEKILRNEYYKVYKDPMEVIDNLSDLIGVRIECRFIEDENAIYKYLKKYFKVYDSNGLYYSNFNPNVKLKIKEKQPKLQKNGFEIYRIDGTYTYNNKNFNFELQIKSIVNMFWGDIEHKIMYKNYNYMLTDNFFREMMRSIKNNLSMIDNQLLVIDTHFNRINTSNEETRKEQVESLLAKILYDIVSSKMKNSIGFVVDFRKACYIIIKYITIKNYNGNLFSDNIETLLKILSRLNEIGSKEIDFNKEIVFEREPYFEDEFSKIIGEKLLSVINSELQWNVFFRILFAIEPKNNVEDFENFVSFIRKMFLKSYGFKKIEEKYKDNGILIKESLMKEIAICFNKIDIIDFLYEDNIIKVNDCIEEICDVIIKNIDEYEDFVKYQEIYYGLLEISILSIFGQNIKAVEAISFIEKVRNTSEKILVSKEILKYINTLEDIEEISADEILTIFKM